MSWTKDKNGEYVNWLDPKYTQGPLVNLALDGEDYGLLPHQVRQQRIREYMRLRERENPLEKRKKPHAI